MDSFRLAPEWARQDAVILVWPHSNSDWRNELEAIESTYIELSRYIGRHQKLLLIAYNQTHVIHIQKSLANNNVTQSNIELINIQTNDTWVRDYGPVVIQSNSESILLDFNFNAWGNKYSYENDNSFNQTFKNKLNSHAQYQSIDFVLEAGNLEINSKGTLLTSSTCFNRNSSNEYKSLLQLENDFKEWFGCTKILWIDDVKLNGDDTDGHIDTLARYCTDDMLVYSASADIIDPNHDSLESLALQLETIKQNTSYITELVPLPLPKPIFSGDQQLPATYTNFLITNKCIYVPVFKDPHDNYALKMIDELFPTHEIIDIESNALIRQFGGIHCASMQVPEGFLL